jgi:hypothetical protein
VRSARYSRLLALLPVSAPCPAQRRRTTGPARPRGFWHRRSTSRGCGSRWPCIVPSNARACNRTTSVCQRRGSASIRRSCRRRAWWCSLCRAAIRSAHLALAFQPSQACRERSAQRATATSDGGCTSAHTWPRGRACSTSANDSTSERASMSCANTWQRHFTGSAHQILPFMLSSGTVKPPELTPALTRMRSTLPSTDSASTRVAIDHAHVWLMSECVRLKLYIMSVCG